MTDFHTYFKQNWALLQQAPVYQPRPNPTFGNPTFEDAPFRALIVRLSPFRDVTRSTPHLFLFQSVRRALPDAYIDMAFFPTQHDRQRLLKAEIPLLTGIQSWHSAEDFDVILVSNAYTLELINLPYLLLNSGISVLASARDMTYPPILLGGSNALATQAIVTETGDAVADAIFFGEGEREVETLIHTLFTHRTAPKNVRLMHAAKSVTGLWIANGPPEQHVQKAICPAPQSADLLTDYPLLNSDEASTARLQVNFGCPAFCSFCFEGYDRKPYREIAPDDVIAAAQHLKRKQGSASIDLYSFNFNTNQDIMALLLDLNRHFDRVNFLSQRVDILATVPSLLEAEVIADKRSYTVGIEGVSHRMRAFLHKSLTDAEIDNVLARLLRQKIREIKLFYILTGHENEEDIAEFRDFVRDLKALRQRTNRGVRIIFSFGLLIRMPFTPLRHDRLFLDESAWRQITGLVKSACETNDFEFRLATPWAEYATTQVLALGGHWLHTPVLVLAAQGHCFDINLSAGYWDALHTWMVENNHWNEAFLGEKPADYRFALDFVEQQIPPDYLHQKYREAMAGIDEGYCLGTACRTCGACTNPAQRKAILAHKMRHPGSYYLRELEDVMRAKWRRKPIYARLWLPPEIAGAEPAWLNAWVMQQILAVHPALSTTLLSAQESLFTTKDNRRRYPALTGETVFALKAWDTSALATALGSNGEGEQGGKAEELRFLGWVDDFEPGSFRKMEIALTLPSAHFRDAGGQLRKFLQAAYVPVNVRRDGEMYRFELSKKARKKKVLLGGAYVQDAVHFTAHLTVSLKFDVVGYLRSFPKSNRWREVSARVIHLEL